MSLDYDIEKITKDGFQKIDIKNLVLDWAFKLGMDAIGQDERGWQVNNSKYSNAVVMSTVNNSKIQSRVKLMQLTDKTQKDLSEYAWTHHK